MESGKIKKALLLLLLVVMLVGTAGYIGYKYMSLFALEVPKEQKKSPLIGKTPDSQALIQTKIKKFESAEDFRSYLKQSEGLRSDMGSGMAFGVGEASLLAPMDSVDFGRRQGMKNALGFESTSPTNRFSETNVQVAGIDEPDIVKTDGKKIYYSRTGSDMIYFGGPRGTSWPGSVGVDDSIAPYVPPSQEISILTAIPVEKIEKAGKIEKYGEMLLHENMLIIFSGRDILGFDIADPKNPIEKWKLTLEERSQLVQARKLGKEIYIVSNTLIDRSVPCPIQPLSRGAEKVMIPCEDIYHPTAPIPVSSTYSLLSVDIASGVVKDKTSFAGTSSNVVVYMNSDSVFVTYENPGDPASLIINFILSQKDLFSAETLARVGKLASYDISQEAKMLEIGKVLQEFIETGNRDAALKLENELENRMRSYMEEHKRELVFTGIVRIAIKGLDVQASGAVPGLLLNQFSLDEYDGHLRVATTIGGGPFAFRGENSANDVYILDEDLEWQGAIRDLGLGERIYSVRFIENKGYVVTFRETDPFYVLDLSDPDDPKKTGELKIPGFSSYLHPLEKDLILGVGRDEGSVKLSLFDVSSPDNPQEVSKYILNEYGSEALDNHHAFMGDSKYEVFFIPGGQGGYVLSYAGKKLELKLASSDTGVKRSLYIGDNLYVIGENGISVYSEKDWTKIKDFKF